MAVDGNVLVDLVPGFPEKDATAADYERAVSSAVALYIHAWSHQAFGEDLAPRIVNADGLGEVQARSRQSHAENMANVVRIAGALDKLYPDADSMPWQDIIESISLTDTDPRTGVPFQSVA